MTARTLTDRWHPTATPCPQYGTPHTCYPCACAYAADRQGIQALAIALDDAGYTVTIEQTGGFTMAVTAYHPPTDGRIVATSDGVGVYAGNAWEEGEDHAEWWGDNPTLDDIINAWHRLYVGQVTPNA